MPALTPPPPGADLKPYLDALVARYERPAFIAADPIALPHAFADARDQEVIGLFAALLAWGRRATILAKLEDLTARMRFEPYRFVLGFDADRDAERLDGFCHRTFSSADAVALVRALTAVLRRWGSVDALVAAHLPPEAEHIGPGIQGLSDTLLTIVPDTPARLVKHVARPSTGSACKRLAMYFRWMTRPGPVDLGRWTSVRPAQLVVPLDVHTGRQARRLGLLDRPQDDWRAVLALTERLRAFEPDDPARYDFALFGLGAYEGQELESVG